MNLAIEAEGLGKRFGETRALDGLDLAVPPGTIFGLLGPDKLAGRVAVIDRGHVVAKGTPAELKEGLGASSLDEVFLTLTAAPEAAS